MNNILNWDSARRQSANTRKAVYNETVSNLMKKYYNRLHKQLVKSEMDEEYFNDTYLKLTYKYSGKNFCEEFLYQFSVIRGGCRRDNKAVKYLSINEDVDFEEEKSFPDFHKLNYKLINQFKKFILESL